MLAVSLLINVLILVPVVGGLLRNTPSTTDVFGAQSPARQILTALYLAILIMSIALLVLLVTRGFDAAWTYALPLLLLQIVYKLLTWPLVRLKHPVVMPNLAVAALHTLTLAVH